MSVDSNTSITQSEFRSKIFELEVANSTEHTYTNLVGLDTTPHRFTQSSKKKKNSSRYVFPKVCNVIIPGAGFSCTASVVLVLKRTRLTASAR